MALGSKLASAGIGALSGAGMGSALGPWGTAAGGLLGGLGGLFGSKASSSSSKGGLFTRPGEEKRFDIYNPQQKDFLNQILGALTGKGGFEGGLLGDLFGEKGFENFSAPYKKQFEEEIIPGIAERFSAGGAQRSSAFQQQLGQAGKDLSTNLAFLRSQQQQSLLGPLLSAFLSPQQHIQYTPGGPTGLAQGLGQFAQGAGQGLAGSGLQALFDWLKSRNKTPTATGGSSS